MLESLARKKILFVGCDKSFAMRLSVLLNAEFNDISGEGLFDATAGDSVVYFANQSIDLDKLALVNKLDGVVFLSPFLDKYSEDGLNDLIPGMLEDGYISFVGILKCLCSNDKFNGPASIVYLASLDERVILSESSSSSISVQAAFKSHLNILSEYLGRLSIRANTVLIDPIYLSGVQMDSLAEALIFFISDASAYITAKEIVVDSGKTLHQAMV